VSDGDDDPGAAAAMQAEIDRLRQQLADAERRIGELEMHADVDPMLEILNRRGFERALVRSLAYVERYGAAAALMFVDLDGFKVVNDRYGHAAGDSLLKVVAAELTGNVRASDVVGRLGGDEFGVLLWNVGGPHATAKARELERTIEQASVLFGAERLSVGASAGIVALSVDVGVAQLIDAADRAMYARKRERRG